ARASRTRADRCRPRRLVFVRRAGAWAWGGRAGGRDRRPRERDLPCHFRPAPVERSGAMSRVARALAVLGVLALALVLGAGPAAAHSVLLETSPARGAAVATAPSKVVLTFNE